MTPLYALLRLVLLVLHPMLKFVASRAVARHDALAKEVDALARKIAYCDQLPSSNAAERLAAVCRDQARLGTLQTCCDGLSDRALYWVGLEGRIASVRSWVATKPGPLCAMTAAYVDMIGTVAAWVFSGGNDPVSLGIDGINYLLEASYWAVDVLGGVPPHLTGPGLGMAGGLACYVATSIARRVFGRRVS